MSDLTKAVQKAVDGGLERAEAWKEVIASGFSDVNEFRKTFRRISVPKAPPSKKKKK